jgi:hypothetical protein
MASKPSGTATASPSDRLPGATRNRLEHNSVQGHAFIGMGASFRAADARELDAPSTVPINAWVDNDCNTDTISATG